MRQRELEAEEMDSLVALRIDLAKRSQWNIGYFVAGFLYWSFATIAGATQPLESAKVFWMVGGFTIFPTAVVLSYLLKADPFTRGNTLGSLIGLTHVSLIGLFIPLIIILFRFLPTALPLAMAIVFGASFPVFAWAFGDRMFLWHIIVRTAGATAMWFALPDLRATLIPAFVAMLYLVTAILIPSRRRAWLRSQGVKLPL
jgi:hypothetical protein